jgi:hypothetical protein
MLLYVQIAFSPPSNLADKDAYHLKIFDVSNSESEKNSINNLKKIRGQTDYYEAISSIKLNITPKEFVLESRNLHHDSSSNFDNNSWRVVKDSFFRAEPSKYLNPLRFDFLLQDWSEPRNISDYSALWVDYAGNCDLNLSLDTQWRDYGDESKYIRRLFDSDKSYLMTMTIPIHTEKWIEADYIYHIKRLLHQKPDLFWRTSQEKKTVVIKRRLHQDISDADVMSLSMLSGWDVVHLNLKVDFKDGYGPGELIEFGNIRPYLMPDGHFGFNLDLQAALRQRFPDKFPINSNATPKQKIYLQEIFVFVPGEISKVSLAKPLNKIVFYKMEGSSTYLSKVDIALDEKIHRKIFDLHPMSVRGDAFLKNASLLVRPVGIKKACTFKLNNARLVKTYAGKNTVSTDIAGKWIHKLGGPFLLGHPDDNHLEQPGILAYLPLGQTLDPSTDYFLRDYGNTNQIGAPSFQSRKFTNTLTGKNKLLANNLGNMPSTPILNFASGASISVSGGKVEYKNINGKSILEGNARRLDIFWPVNANLKQETMIYFNVGHESEQLESIFLEILTESGKLIHRQITQNKPMHLVDMPTSITSIKLILHPKASKYKLSLLDLTLFEPSLIKESQTIFLRLPSSVTTLPIPTFIKGISNSQNIKPGHISGFLDGSGHLEFKTLLNAPINHLTGLNIKYKSSSSNKKYAQCMLQLNLHWDKGVTQHDLCPKFENGEVFLSFPELFLTKQMPHNLGLLHSIEWFVNIPNDSEHKKHSFFSFDLSLVSWKYLSALDVIKNTPLFNVDSQAVFMNSNDIDKNFSERNGNISTEIPLSLKKNDIELIVNANAPISPFHNLLFTLDSITLIPMDSLGENLLNQRGSDPTLFFKKRTISVAIFTAICMTLILALVFSRGRYLDMRSRLRGIHHLLSNSCPVLKKSINSAIKLMFRYILILLQPIIYKYPLLSRWLLWIFLTIILYSAGLFLHLSNDINYFFTAASMTSMMVIIYFFLTLELRLKCINPIFSEAIFSSVGGLLFASALVSLLFVVLFLSLNLEPVAEQFAITSYLSAVVGVTKVFFSQWRTNRKNKTSRRSKVSNNA